MIYNTLIFFLCFKKNSPRGSSVFIYKISIIVAAKNEEKNISILIDALTNQEYNKSCYEIIIVDDASTDETENAVKKVMTASANIKYIKAENKKYPAKKGALDIGINSAAYDTIAITDADCVPERKWLASISAKINEGYDFVFGVAPFFDNNRLAAKIARYENFRNSILTFSFANIGLPYSAAARSIAFSKKSFLEVGGYSNTLDVQSGDDDLLLREFVKNKKRISTFMDKESFVYSEAKDNFPEYFSQKARHLSTSNYYLLRHKIVLGVWHLVNTFLFFSLFLSLLDINFLYLFIIKYVFDIFLTSARQTRFGYKFRAYEIILAPLFYDILLIVHYFRGLFKVYKWK